MRVKLLLVPRGLALLVLSVFAFFSCSLFPATQATWTIMMYVDGDNNLEANALEDINEMELASFPSSVNVIVLVDRTPGESAEDENWTGTRLYEIRHDEDIDYINSTRLSCATLGITTSSDVELNMADTDVLEKFITFCEDTYPASNTMLVLWNHGEGWRSDSDDKTFVKTAAASRMIISDDTSDDTFYNYEVRTVLETHPVTVLGFDACLMGMFEVAYEFSEVADYMIASPDSEPGDGWDYASWLTTFGAGSLTPDSLCSAVVNAYGAQYATSMATTLAAYDLSKMSSLMTALDNYALDLIALSNNWWDQWGASHTNIAAYVRNTLLNSVDRIENGYNEIRADLWDMADKIAMPSSTALKAAIDDLVILEWHNTSGDIFTGNPNSHGIAIYFGSVAECLFDYAFEYYTDPASDLRLASSGSKWTKYIASTEAFPPYTFATVGAYTGCPDEGYFDYYQVYVTNSGTLYADLTVPSYGDDDLYLIHDGSRLASSIYNDPNESVSYAVTDGWWIIAVRRYEASSSDYSLTISTAPSGILQ